MSGRIELAPLTTDVEAAVVRARLAIEHECGVVVPPQDPAEHSTAVAERTRQGEVEGRLVRSNGAACGVVLWDPGHALGRTVGILYLDPASSSVSNYGALVDALEADGGRVAILPGDLAGLDRASEERVLAPRGYERFARSELRFPEDRTLPAAPALPGLTLRAVVAEDVPALAGLHAEAFGGTFDQYLFQTDPDPVRDGLHLTHDIQSGKYGEYLPWASTIVEGEDGPLGASLVTRTSRAPLLISVMVSPRAQGRGLGRALVIANLRALRERGEAPAVLNVTEGNAKAVRLYERLGFVRSIGFGHAWFDRTRVPVRPDGSPTTSPPRGSAGERS